MCAKKKPGKKSAVLPSITPAGPTISEFSSPAAILIRCIICLVICLAPAACGKPVDRNKLLRQANSDQAEREMAKAKPYIKPRHFRVCEKHHAERFRKYGVTGKATYKPNRFLTSVAKHGSAIRIFHQGGYIGYSGSARGFYQGKPGLVNFHCIFYARDGKVEFDNSLVPKTFSTMGPWKYTDDRPAYIIERKK